MILEFSKNSGDKSNIYEASKIIKEKNELAKIPIIAVTASVMKEQEKKVMRNCDFFLSKPVARHDLLVTIATAFGMKKKNS